MSTKTYTFHVSGTHCASCKIFIEDVLNEQTGIENAHVNLKQETVSFDTSLDDNEQKLAEVLTEKIKDNGYALSIEKKVREKKDSGVILQALPIGLALLALFFIVQKSGILNVGLGGTVTPVTVLLSVLLHPYRVVLRSLEGLSFLFLQRCLRIR